METSKGAYPVYRTCRQVCAQKVTMVSEKVMKRQKNKTKKKQRKDNEQSKNISLSCALFHKSAPGVRHR